MNNKHLKNQRGAASLHPVMWIAAIAVTAFAIVGIAKVMGWVGAPTTPNDSAQLATLDAPATSKTDAPAAKPTETEKAPVAKSNEPKAPTKKTSSKPSATTGGSDYAQAGGSDTQRVTEPARVICGDCGTITAIRPVEVEAEGSGAGAVAGGVLGGVVGNQFGKGSGKTVATVAGAVLGGVAGHKAEEKIRAKTVYDVSLRMDDGSSRSIRMEQAPMYGQGQHVRVSGNQLFEAPR